MLVATFNYRAVSSILIKFELVQILMRVDESFKQVLV